MPRVAVTVYISIPFTPYFSSIFSSPSHDNVNLQKSAPPALLPTIFPLFWRSDSPHHCLYPGSQWIQTDWSHCRLFLSQHRHQKEPDGTLASNLKETCVLPCKLSHLISQLATEGERDVSSNSDSIAHSLTLPFSSSFGGNRTGWLPLPFRGQSHPALQWLLKPCSLERKLWRWDASGLHSPPHTVDNLRPAYLFVHSFT